jgi:hypothetical protein
MNVQAFKKMEESSSNKAVQNNYDIVPFSDKPYAVLKTDKKDFVLQAKEELEIRGCVVLRGLLSPENLNTIQESVFEITKKPAIGGSVGYYMKDCGKKMYDPLLLCEEVVHAVLDERMLDCIEAYVNEKVILAEVFMKQDLGIDDVYFNIHSDYHADSIWANNPKYPITEETMHKPFAIGAMLYLEDTAEGAFCYSEGTHHWGAPISNNPSAYPAEVQKKIKDRLIRVDGKAGDLVIFDDRGFHGPEQPSTVRRTVLIFDFTKVTTFGKTVKSPMPIFVPFLRHLSQRQLDVLGWNCEINVPYKNHHMRSFHRNNYYKLVSGLYKLLFAFDKAKITLRNKLKGHKPTIRAKNYKKHS